MQEKTTPESGKNSRLRSQGSDTFNLLPLSGETGMKEVIHNPATDTNSIKHLLNEMMGLHEQRLRCLEMDATISREELLQKKVDFLQSYVNDFADQNQVLAQTIEELQKEAEHKFYSGGMKLSTSDPILDMSEVDVRTLLLDGFVRPVAHIPYNSGSPVQIADESKDLKIHLQNKDMVNSDLETELIEQSEQMQKVLKDSEQRMHLQSELSCLQQIHKDSMKEIAEKDVYITKLQANIQLLQQEGVDTHDQLSKLNMRMSKLQEELKRKEEEWGQREEKLKLKYEKEHQKAEEKRCQEQQKRAEEWVKRVEGEKRTEEEWKRRIEDERQTHAQAVKKWADKAATLNSQIKEREEHVRHLDQDVVALRATLDSLKETLAVKEKHTQQLVQENTKLKESLATLQSKLQTSECMFSHINESLDHTKCTLSAERQQKQQIQDQLHRGNEEIERLQQELTDVHRTTEKRIQKREAKICALVKELTESKKQHSDCQKVLLRSEKELGKLCEERDVLKTKMEHQTRERLEADLAVSHKKIYALHLEVQSRDQLIMQLRGDMKTAEQKHQGTQEQVAALEDEVRHLNNKIRGHQEATCQLNKKIRDIERLKDQKEKERQELHDQFHISQQQLLATHHQLKGAKEELKDANLQAQEQKQTTAILKKKYMAAMEKVDSVQVQVKELQEELCYSQQQLRESQLATKLAREELAELERRYQEAVGQWENSQEALDQLTDQLQANRILLKESQQKVDHFKSLMESLQEQGDTLKQQKLMLEGDLQLYRQMHSHSNDEYLRLVRKSQQLQELCTEQEERLAECEKAILQMKSELERQAEEKLGLKQTLAKSHHTYLKNRNQLEQEVSHLKKAHMELVRRSEEELKGAWQEVAISSKEVDVQKGEVQRLQDKLQEEEEKLRSAIREKQSLSSCIRHMNQEMEKLHSKHQVTVKELAARAEEVRQMEECLSEGKLAEEKIRSMAMSLEKEVVELTKNLQQAVDQKLKAEKEKENAQDQWHISGARARIILSKRGRGVCGT
ncbi:trichohyalin-like isoform X2 [Channa argus]|uniref:trichohyalin-like isoform X2 n=1 Tax=Channa argus TaxID=215402 RepID=UPI003520715C